MRIVIEDNVERNRVSVRIVGQSTDLNFMDALIGSLSKIRSFNGKSKENPNQMKFVSELSSTSKRRRR